MFFHCTSSFLFASRKNFFSLYIFAKAKFILHIYNKADKKLIAFSLNSLINAKSATTEAVAQKTQTPIVAKPHRHENAMYSYRQNLHFYQIQGTSTKGYNYPDGAFRDLSSIRLWFGNFSISHIFLVFKILMVISIEKNTKSEKRR